MALHPLDLMEPEETVGNLWHDYASGIGADQRFDDEAVTLSDVRHSLVMLFRALGGDASVEIGEAPAVRTDHRLSVSRKLGTARETLQVPRFDGARLGLPPVIDAFPDAGLNRAAYRWLTAMGAFATCPAPNDNAELFDWAQIRANSEAADQVFAACPGLRVAYRAMCDHILQTRRRPILPPAEARVENAIREQLSGVECGRCPTKGAGRGYMPYAPVPIWLSFGVPEVSEDAPRAEEDTAPPPAAATTKRKLATRKNRDEANRLDSFIIHRFEAILSWVESMNLNRMVDDDEDENAQKAADDQDNITLSRHDKKAATRLRMHLDLSPEDADHERMSGEFTYPEWNHKNRSYMPDHCRVLEAEQEQGDEVFAPDPQLVRHVRRQFEALRPRRILRPRQIEGSELDLDALITARVDMKATGESSDRIYQSMRSIDRDLSVAFLLDTSRSTEAAVGDTCVIDVARQALAAFASGIEVSGDRLGIWGFSSLKRDRVFLSRCKDFDAPISPEVTARIGSLTPGHYTRLGAAIRHVSAMLDKETAARKLLIVLTDGKPNDLDHYEGVHGIEDSRMAVREARQLGQTVHGIVIDEDGQDWFARIFNRAGFSLLPEPARLTRALPEIYRSLTQEI
ncbi:nitric oxide reductase activation protein NorD [Aliiroseovarius sp. YM-037]|uniref:nitric oxide reductase activation protein NorD n=1 Tax=Aliiroseovarius sp. YM-037 TaxID=3341728 RepID=UPI003A7FAF5E